MATCFHHKDRETYRSCTRCDRPACPDCLRDAAVGSHCFECIRAAAPSRQERVRRWRAANPLVVTYALIAINVAIWIALFIITGNQDGLPKSEAWGIYSGSIAFNHEYYRIVSSGFLHFSAIHVAFNSFALFNLGGFLEREYGPKKFVALYFAALVFGSFGAMLLDPNALTGGASGAVFGLMGAAAVNLHHKGVPLGKSPLIRVIGLNLIITFTIPQISKGGHIGGLIGGAIVGWAYTQQRDPDKKFLSWAAPLVVGVIGVVGAVMAAKSAAGV